jgi:hypothetical protein
MLFLCRGYRGFTEVKEPEATEANAKLSFSTEVREEFLSSADVVDSLLHWTIL